MFILVSFLSAIFYYILKLCYSLLHNYWLAIILFALLSKVALLPLSMWVHKNSIKFVMLLPEINQIKIKFFGDKDRIDIEQQDLYKRNRYNAFTSIIPIAFQVLVLIGLTGAMRLITENSASATIAYIPSEAKGNIILIPILAAFSALFLGLFQNKINPLQKEQSKMNQACTNSISIIISLFLGFFVPAGVGFYWICSNILTILQQLFLNIIIPPKKYINYTALVDSNQKLAELNSLSNKSSYSSTDTKRERADFKNFFSIINKHLVFYSESNGFYKYFENIIEELLKRSNIIIHYITSDPNDSIFEKAKTQPRIKPYFIGEKKLITLMMKMDADMVVMTMPDLENYHIKRSYIRKDVEYVYVFHGLFAGMRTLRKGALDHFDTVFCTGRSLSEEIRAIEKSSGVPEKRLVPCGYGLIDNMAKAYESMERKINTTKTILIAPSWQDENILESCISDIAEELLNVGYSLIVRPHPQYLKRNSQKFELIVENCKPFSGDRFCFETDFSSNETVFLADLLITDWSSIGFEYSIATKKPALFINTPLKIVNNDLIVNMSDGYLPLDIRLRNIIGKSIEPCNIKSSLIPAVSELFMQTGHYEKNISEIRKNEIYNFGESGKYGALYIIDKLKRNRK